jgi:hypothetical protein
MFFLVVRFESVNPNGKGTEQRISVRERPRFSRGACLDLHVTTASD